MASRRMAVVSGEADMNCKESLEFQGASTIAQVFQGIAFLALAVFLIFANNAKVGGGRKAPLEQRYMTSLTIATAVCLFSGFFNILQMTGLDDFELPRSTTFTLDLSRPVEWILTCPVMQLILVILGGARLPSYRKFMMPLLTAANLLCGVAAMFSDGAMQWTWFCFGFMLWAIYTYYNVQQIKENSDGDESFLRGDSDYRKISVITISTWLPFPLWFIVSPEGLGLVTDVTTIQCGWAVLNVIAKFGFILHLQHIKSKYCKNLDATRELYGVQATGQNVIPEKPPAWPGEGSETPEEDGGEAKIMTLISETMVSLGMSSHADRFVKMMLDNGIVSTDILERLTQERSMDLSLPWSLCEAVQRRWRAEKMNLGQDRGGEFTKEDPFKKLLQEGKERRAMKGLMLPSSMGGMGMPGMGVAFPEVRYVNYAGSHPGTGTCTPPLANHGFPVVADSRAANLEMQMTNVMQNMESLVGMMESMTTKVDRFDSAQEAICQRLDFAQQAQLHTLNSSQVLLHKVDSSQEDMLQRMGAHKQVLDKLAASQDGILESLSGTNDSAKQALLDSVANASKAMLQKLDDSQQELLQKQGEAQEMLSQVSKTQDQIVQKMDASHEATARTAMEAEAQLDAKFQDVVSQVAQTCETAAGELSKAIGNEMGNLACSSASSGDRLERGLALQEEWMSDMRRQNMMIMDMLTSTQERVVQSADSIASFNRRDLAQDSGATLEVELRGAISAEMGRLQQYLETLLAREDEGSVGVGRSCVMGSLSSCTDRLEAAAKRLESEGDKTAAGECGIVEEVVRREISAVAMALVQQQREVAEHQTEQVREAVGEKVRGELWEVATKVEKLEDAMGKGIARLEQGVCKLLAPPDEPRTPRRKVTSERTERAERAERG
eukprot:gb/GFBE01020972.1/.p1 GENE.gb/GFBE01020972.1/~~gb/GFBE01020972.1/.p1  ORF type:complete len:894 (+),score=279.97 gb/GFBE01020972.1/:1-2682(+)